jgi:septum formation protein
MLVLASASPRRQELLRNAGITFEVRPSHIPEDPLDGEPPRACAERLAREKATEVWQARPNDYVLGADTIVLLETSVLNKPQDRDDAARMLRLLSGKQHEVITGVCLAGPGISPDVRSEVTRVFMEIVPEPDIQEYAASPEPMDKAGAYAIQGIASRWISRIEGDYFNVVGLPVGLVYRMLKEHKVL